MGGRAPRDLFSLPPRAPKRRTKRQHQNNVRKSDIQRSALAEHCEKADHRIDFAGAQVIDTKANYPKRILLESRHVQATWGRLNISLGALSPFTPKASDIP